MNTLATERQGDHLPVELGVTWRPGRSKKFTHCSSSHHSGALMNLHQTHLGADSVSLGKRRVLHETLSAILHELRFT